MSAIDSIPHARVGRFGRIPVYLCLADGPWLGTPGDAEVSSVARRFSLSVGGGSGEHPAAVLRDVASAVRAYLQFCTDATVIERPEIVFCDGMTSDQWMDEFSSELHDSLEFSVWMALCLGEFVLFMLPDIHPGVAEVRAAHAKYLAGAEPFFCMVSIPWESYRGNGEDYFQVVRRK